MAEPGYNIEHINFVIVDDNQHMRMLVRSLLAALGARSVREAGDTEEAFRLLKLNPIDIVICDWHMQPMNGLDFVRKLRNDKTSRNPMIPVIMLTAYSEKDRVTEARDCGVNEFVVKPISAKTLYARIKEIIKHPRAFVQTPDYFGPDRRRRDFKYSGAERRQGANPTEVTQDEIRALLKG